MALVTYVLGDCPGCGAKESYGNVDVFRTYLYRGCKRCRYNEHVNLPVLRKKVLYLDQFFFSHAFRGGEVRFVEAADRITQLASLQLLVVPFSSIHEDETHQWEKRDELFKFIKATARGHEFKFAFDIEQKQLNKSFQMWLQGIATDYVVNPTEALSGEVHQWDSYMRIEVGRYMGNIDLIRDLKQQSIEGLVDLFPGWRELTTSFDDDLQAEHAAAGKGYLDFYIQYLVRISAGDFDAMFDAPMISMVVQSLLRLVPETVPAEERLRNCAQFLFSDHFKALPYQWLHAHMFASLKAMVREGAYTNREGALKRLSGVFYDVKHIATYAPYVDAFVMDQPMAGLVSRPTVELESRFGTKVFSLNNWDAFMAWLDSLEADMTQEHRDALAIVYPRAT